MARRDRATSDDVTGHLLEVIDKKREENEELSAEVERLQITIRRLRMEIVQRDTRIVAMLGDQTTVPTVTATFHVRIGQEVTATNFTAGYLVTALRDPPVLQAAGGIGLYTVAWETLEHMLGVTAGHLLQRRCSLRRVSTFQQALEFWRAAGHRGPITRIG